MKLSFVKKTSYSVRLHFTKVILARFFTVSSMQSESIVGAVFTDQKTLSAVFAPLLHVYTAHTVRTTEKCYFGR
jgi:hypothetical protein